MAAIDEKQFGQVPTGVIPTNLNEQGFIAFGEHIKGGSYPLPYLKAPASDPAKWDDVNKVPVLDGGGEPIDPDYLPPYRRAPGLLDIHPNRMRENMKISFKQEFERIEVILTRDPDFINEGDITEDNWQDYWTITSKVIPDNAQILEFAEEYDGSLSGWPDEGRPPYDDATGTYPSGAQFDALWESVQYIERHRWYRIKYVDYDENGDPIVGRISPPIPISQDSTTFVTEVFKYKRAGVKGTDTPADVIPDTPPPFNSSGQPNNNPTGWEDTPPASPDTEYLWRTKGLKEIKGDINTQVGWSKPAIVPEDTETTRYSATGKPNPETIVNQNEDVADGTNEADLAAAGWVPPLSFDETVHNYIATRSGSSLNWTAWKVERISPQDTEIIKRRYKLLPRLSDYDDPTWISSNKPSGSDPSNQGWLGEIQTETNFLVNFVSEAVFYADNTIKQDWSSPVPFTSQLTYNDYISIHPDDSNSIDATKQIDDTIIKRYVNGVETYFPEKLWLRAQIFSGNNDVLADASIEATYQWYKIFNDGEFITAVDLGTNRDIQVDNTDVTGRAIFQVEITLSDATGYTAIQDAIDDGAIDAAPVFTEEISIIDQVDGRDGRTLSASATQPYFIENSDPAYLPNSIIIRAEVDNADKNDVNWYYLNGSDPINDTWIEITATTNTSGSTPKHTYKNSNNDLVLVGGATGTATDIFSTVLAQDDVYFKAEIPAVGALDALEDWVMVSRRDQADLAAGESAFDVHIENPFHQIRVDSLGDYLAGQIADVQSQIEVRKGSTVQAHSAYTVSVVSVSGVLTDTNDVLVGNDGGNKKIITLDEPNVNWDNAEDKGSIVIDVTLSGETKRVYIGLGTVLEPTGFTGLNIKSDRATFTFDYSSGGRADIVLTAELTRHTESGNEIVAGYNYEWLVVSGRYKSVGAGNVITDSDVVDEVMTISPDDLDQSAVYRCYAYLTKTGSTYNDPVYTAEVRINDVPDTSVKLLFNANDSIDVPPLPLNAFDSYANNSSGTDTWYKVEQGNGNDTWYSINTSGGAAGEWQGPFRIKGSDGQDGADGADGINGQDGTDGLNGGLYNWEGSEAILTSTSISGARVHILGKIQNDDLAGLWICIYHTDLETGARVAVGTTTANATELGTFNGGNNQTQWRIFWCPVAALVSETVDVKLYIWSSNADGGTIRKIIVHAASNGIIGADGISVVSATITSGDLVLGLSGGGSIVAGRVEYQTEFRNSGTYIQWKYTHEGSGSWRNIVALADISGSDGQDGITDGIAKFWYAKNTGNFQVNSSWQRTTYINIGTAKSGTFLVKISMKVYNDDNDRILMGLKVQSSLPPSSSSTANNITSYPARGGNKTSIEPFQIHKSEIVTFSSDSYIAAYISAEGGGSGIALRHAETIIELYELN